jgi:hypothetical protein
MNSITAEPQTRVVNTHERTLTEGARSVTAGDDFYTIDPRYGQIYYQDKTLEPAQRLANLLTARHQGSTAFYVLHKGAVVHVGDPTGDVRTAKEVYDATPRPPVRYWMNDLPTDFVSTRRSIRARTKMRREYARPLFFQGPRKRGGLVDDLRDWNLPTTGGRLGGHAVGEAAAMEWFKALTEAERPVDVVPLHAIVKSMMCRFQDLNGRCNNERAADAQTDEFKAFDGQCHAFFLLLQSWLEQLATVPNAKWHVGKVSLDEILAQANRGLTFDAAGHWASEEAKIDAYFQERAAQRRAERQAEKNGGAS